MNYQVIPKRYEETSGVEATRIGASSPSEKMQPIDYNNNFGGIIWKNTIIQAKKDKSITQAQKRGSFTFPYQVVIDGRFTKHARITAD